MANDLTLHIVTPTGAEQDVSLVDVLKSLPRQKQLMLHYSAGDNKVIANFGGGTVSSGDDVPTAVAAAYNAYLAAVQIENPNRKKEPSYVQPDLTRKPLAGETIPFGSLPSHVKRRSEP